MNKIKADWRNRIVDRSEVAAGLLVVNPRNWRTHPMRQKKALRSIIDSVGWVQDVIVNKQTGNLVDGHARVELALERGSDELVPVVYIDVSEDEEKKILACLDPISAMAEYDVAKLSDLLCGVTDLPEALAEDLGSLIIDDDSTENSFAVEQGIFALREDAIFPSSNRWGLPELRNDKLASTLPKEIWINGEPRDPSGMLFLHGTNRLPANCAGGTLGFYVDDYRFDRIWTEAVRTVEEFRHREWGGIIAPDFSVWRDDPMAVQLWNIYRSRWCARYWQEAGIPIIPSLNWSDERSYEFAFVGLPLGAPLVSCQCRTTRSRKGKEFFLSGIARAIEEIRPMAVLLYGGEEHRAWLETGLPAGPNYHYLDNWTRARDRARKIA